MKRMTMLALASAALCAMSSLSIAGPLPSPKPDHEPRFNVGGVMLTRAQVADVRRNFTLVRTCPAELNPYAINEKGGDCLGGESGAPAQSGGGGGGGD